MQSTLFHSAVRRVSLWLAFCTAFACVVLLLPVSQADEVAEPLPIETPLSTATPNLPESDEPAYGYSREQSAIKNEAYKQFIKLQVSLAAGTKNSLGLSSYEQAHAHYCALAGESRDPDALFAMGWFYSMGKGVAVNHDIAARFFQFGCHPGPPRCQGLAG